MRTFILLFTLSFLMYLSYAIEMDYCVGDPSLPRSPSGLSCKDTSKLTVDDFVYTGFRTGSKPTLALTAFNSNVTLAFVDEYPALNGLGISMARLDYGVGGVIPLHTHRTSEMIVVIEGSIIAGFIDTNDTAYYKTLQVGDVMIFPEGLLHFQVNVGDTPALAIVSLNSPNPALQVIDFSLFSGNMPAELTERTMLLSHEEVMRLKKIFGSA